jgi:hypothetical protein
VKGPQRETERLVEETEGVEHDRPRELHTLRCCHFVPLCAACNTGRYFDFMDAFFGCNMFTAQLAAAAAATADVGAAVDAATKPAVAAAGEHEAVPRETGKDAD